MAHTAKTEEDVRERMNGTDAAFLRLWDLYGGLLTEKQREITLLYLECDLSLGEIAEEKGMSRSGVSDCLHKSRKKLEEADARLHFTSIIDGVEEKYSRLKANVFAWAKKEEQKHPEWVAETDELVKYTQEGDAEIEQ